MSDVPPPDVPAAPQPDWAHSFGGVSEAYERGRPTYPDEAVRWMLGEQPLSVLELGAGTGKLTRVMVSLGHDVHATDPDAAMLKVLESDFARIPELLGRGLAPAAAPEPVLAAVPEPAPAAPAEQLGLF